MIWLIDDRGKTWPAEAHPIARWNPADRPFSYAVAERGFVRLRASAGAMTISFNPRRVRWVTLATTGYFMSTCRPRRVALTHDCPEERATEIFGSSEAALRRMEELSAASPREQATILSQTRRDVNQRLNNSPEVRELLAAWADANGRWTRERFVNLRAGGLLATTAVARNAAGTARFTNLHWGEGLLVLGTEWSKIAVGKEATDQPFRQLARNVAALYRRAIEEDWPARYEVSSLFPGPNGRSIRRDYERLLLPWRSAGERYVMHVIFRMASHPVPLSRGPSASRLG